MSMSKSLNLNNSLQDWQNAGRLVKLIVRHTKEANIAGVLYFAKALQDLASARKEEIVSKIAASIYRRRRLRKPVPSTTKT
jgi:predicted RNA-binding protein (virulence factor B family)